MNLSTPFYIIISLQLHNFEIFKFNAPKSSNSDMHRFFSFKQKKTVDLLVCLINWTINLKHPLKCLYFRGCICIYILPYFFVVTVKAYAFDDVARKKYRGISDLTDNLSNLNYATRTIARSNCLTSEMQPLSDNYPTREQLLYQTSKFFLHNYEQKLIVNWILPVIFWTKS